MSSRTENLAALGKADSKRQLNRVIFRLIAKRYPVATRTLSFGRDAAWKRDFVRDLSVEAPEVCLDLATGTGDLARLLADRYSPARIVGLDLIDEMVAEARRHDPDGAAEYCVGDIGAMEFPDGFADLVTGGYALRNVPDLAMALDEIHRVLKPGGVAAFLDFAHSSSPATFRLHHFLLHVWGGICGLILHGKPWVYRYIPDSMAVFPDTPTLREMAEKAGFEWIGTDRRMFGVIEFWQMRKRES